MRTRELLDLRNTGHPGINSLFAKAHSVDWTVSVDAIGCASHPLIHGALRATEAAD